MPLFLALSVRLILHSSDRWACPTRSVARCAEKFRHNANHCLPCVTLSSAADRGSEAAVPFPRSSQVSDMSLPASAWAFRSFRLIITEPILRMKRLDCVLPATLTVDVRSLVMCAPAVQHVMSVASTNSSSCLQSPVPSKIVSAPKALISFIVSSFAPSYLKQTFSSDLEALTRMSRRRVKCIYMS